MLKTQNLTRRNELAGQPAEVLRALIHSAESAGDYPRLALAWDALAHYHWRAGEYRLARAVLTGGLALLPVEFIRERLMLTNTLLMVELFAGRYEFVITRSPAAVADAELLGDAYLRAQAHRNFADALKKAGETDRAIEQFTAAGIYFEEAGHARHFAANDNNLAELYATARDFGQAHYYLDRAERTLRELGDTSAVGQTCETRARALFLSEELDAALDVILLSLALLPETERGARAESFKTKGDIHTARGEYDEARRAYLEGMRLLEEAARA